MGMKSKTFVRQGQKSRSSFLQAVLVLGTLGVTLVACASAPKAPATPTAELASSPTALQDGFLSEQLSTATLLLNGWGPIEKNRSNGDDVAGDGERLSLSGIKYTKGLGAHSDSTAEFPLDGDCLRFKVSMGLDDSVRPGGKFNAGGQSSVVFQVYLDNKLAFDSGVMTEKSLTRELNLKLPLGAKRLRLVVTDAGDGILYDHADWANARVECGADTLPASS
jgi:NPCBM/NEW2 domain